MRGETDPERVPPEHRFLALFTLAGLTLLFSFSVAPVSQAQVTTAITPSGLNTAVAQDLLQPNIYNITGGTRPGNGPNLFHSFADFSVAAVDTARFLNTTPDLATTNILGRVTGGNPSSIFGTIDTLSYPGANLFLMNPAGIVFGPNVTLNVGGAVHFTTADYLRLEEIGGGNAGIFHTDLSQESVLTSAPVAAFGFLGSNPAAISVQGSTLAVQPGQSISLVGGHQGFSYSNPDTGAMASVSNGMTVIGGKLSAPRGQVNLAGTASPGEFLAGTWQHAANTSGESFGSLGAIEVTQKSVLDVSGPGGGTVAIRGGQFVLNDSIVSANITGPAAGMPGKGIDILVAQDAVIENGAFLDTSIFGNATPGVQYGGVTIKADRIEILGSKDFGNFPETGIFSDVGRGSTGGNSGDIRLEANSILMRDFGTESTLLGAQTQGAGNSGSISLISSGNVEMDLAGIFTGSFSGALGSAGSIALVSMRGSILLNETLVLSNAIRAGGKSSFISLSAPQGDILLDASQVGNRSFLAGGLGTVDIGTTKVSLQIIANNLRLNDSLIGGDNFDPTPAGTISLTLDGSLSLNDNSVFQTVARGPAAAADINVRAHDVNIAESSFLSSETKSSGAGGQLNIFTENLQLTSGGGSGPLLVEIKKAYPPGIVT